MRKEDKMIKAYKGFDKDLKCRGFQYEVGKEYVTDHAIACTTGFHCCENPFDVFGYYAPCDDNGSMNRFCEVEAGGDIDTSKEDKISCTHLKVKAEIGLYGLIKAGVKFILDKIKWDDDNATNTGNRSASTNTGNRSAATNTGDCSAATNTGDWSAATNTGDCSAATNTGNWSAATNTGNCSAATNTGNRSAATNTGDRSAATNTGDWSAATNTGNWSAATNTGDRSAATNTGDCSAATNTGDWSAATNTGDWSAATNTGDRSTATNTGYRSAATNTGDRSAATNTGNCSAASVEGKDSIAIVTGKDSKAKGALGCWIVLTERGEWNGEAYPILDVKAFKVDGVAVEANTWYKLKDGQLIKAED